MGKYFFHFVVFTISLYSQSGSVDFHSPQNIKKFADYLFCENDYLRAAEEYDTYRKIINDDTVDFKIILCYSRLNAYQLLKNYYSKVPIRKDSPFYYDAQYEFLKNEFIYSSLTFHTSYDSITIRFPDGSRHQRNLMKLRMCSYLYEDKFDISKEIFLHPFGEDEVSKVSEFYDWKKDPPYKNSALAGIFSAVIPGSGKMYVDEWGDGITAFLVSGLFAFLAYDNFKADHNSRAWIFTGLGTLFYGGNIYGSIASAQIYNAKINFEFNDGLKLFLEEENYFSPAYNFCE
jgi:TM2 domain-containing membrane protein YozV